MTKSRRKKVENCFHRKNVEELFSKKKKKVEELFSKKKKQKKKRARINKIEYSSAKVFMNF